MDGEPVSGLGTIKKSIPEGTPPDMGGIISFEDYSFTYISSEEPAIKNVNLKIEPGEVVLLAGSSGCGKSTLLRSINGLIPHMYPGTTSGSVHVDGVNVAETSITEVAKKVGFVFQNPENQIFMFSVERDVAFGLENLGVPRDEMRERVNWAIQLLGIEHLAGRAPHELSDGQKQRVALAGVLAMKPSVLILDEPTSLLDPSTAFELVEVVEMLNDELGLTVIVVEHRLDLLVHAATRIICMDNGKLLYDGSPRRILAEKELPIIGISVPTTARLHNLLKDEEIDLKEIPLSTIELTKRLNVMLK